VVLLLITTRGVGWGTERVLQPVERGHHLAVGGEEGGGLFSEGLHRLLILDLNRFGIQRLWKSCLLQTDRCLEKKCCSSVIRHGALRLRNIDSSNNGTFLWRCYEQNVGGDHRYRFLLISSKFLLVLHQDVDLVVVFDHI
jgi:hypothetical protein